MLRCMCVCACMGVRSFLSSVNIFLIYKIGFRPFVVSGVCPVPIRPSTKDNLNIPRHDQYFNCKVYKHQGNKISEEHKP